MVTNNYTPYAGGVVRAIQTYTHELQQQGHTVYIITLDFGVTNDPWYVVRVPSCFRWSYRNNILSVPWRAYRYVDAYIAACNPDIIHAHSPFVLGNAGLYAARKRRIPIVFTYHSLYERFVSYVPVPQVVTRRLVLRYVHAFCRKVDGVIAPSSFIYDRLQQLHGPVWQVPTPIRPVFFHTKRSTLQETARYILSVGRFQPEKQLHYVIDAFAIARRHVTTKLVLIGFGASYWYLRWYAYTYWNLQYEDVIFICKPEQDELVRWYQYADMFVSASPEAQGLVFAEAFACGVPVIAFSGAGVNDIVQHGVNGFLVYDADEMAQCVCYLYDNTQLFSQMQHYAYRTGKAYHPSVGIERLVNCYHTVIEKNRSGGS